MIQVGMMSSRHGADKVRLRPFRTRGGLRDTPRVETLGSVPSSLQLVMRALEKNLIFLENFFPDSTELKAERQQRVQPCSNPHIPAELKARWFKARGLNPGTESPEHFAS